MLAHSHIRLQADGKIDRTEWLFVVEYVTASHAIAVHNKRAAKSRLTEQMRSEVPPKLLEHMASQAFADKCHVSFDKIDTDNSNALEPNELWNECVDLVAFAEPDAPPLTKEECLDIILSTFDVNVSSRERR